MDRRRGRNKVPKFGVYQNPSLSAALTSNSNSLRPSKSTFLCILSLYIASALALLVAFFRQNGIIDSLKLKYFPQEIAYVFAKAIQTVAGVIVIGTIVALINAISAWMSMNDGVGIVSTSNGMKEKTRLTDRQLGLMGIKPKVEQDVSKTKSACRSNTALVPLHPPFYSSNRMGGDKSNQCTSWGNKMHCFSAPSKLPASPSFYHVPSPSSHTPLFHTSPGFNKRSFFTKEITTKEKFQQFLAESDEKISELMDKLDTPPLTTVRLTPEFNSPPRKVRVLHYHTCRWLLTRAEATKHTVGSYPK